MQKRLSNEEKERVVSIYRNNEMTARDLSKIFNISSVAVLGILKRRGVAIRNDQSILQRKFAIDESYFDLINSEEKAYILGLLYADGYNNQKRNAVSLSLQEGDLNILEKINNLIQPSKPIQYVRTSDAIQNQYRITFCSKKISKRLAELGCSQAKTFHIQFPSLDILPEILIRHFLRGYWDGDGWIGERSMSIVATDEFCLSVSKILEDKLQINSHIRTRHPERDHNIRMLEVSGGKKVRRLCLWLYGDSKLSLDRKFKKAGEHINAAINISAAGLAASARGGAVRPERTYVLKARPVKREPLSC